MVFARYSCFKKGKSWADETVFALLKECISVDEKDSMVKNI